MSQDVSSQSKKDLQADLQRLILKEARIDKKKVPGILISVITKDSIQVFSFGSRYIDSLEKLSDKSIFELGDVSKMLLTYLCLEIEKKGIISLDSTMVKYLGPEFNNPALANITVLDYLIYKTPFPRLPKNIGETQLIVNQPYQHYDKQKLLEFYNGFIIPEKYKNEYLYNHTNFVFVQLMLEKLTNKTIEQLIETYYKNTLNLNSIGFYSFNSDKVIKGYSLSKKLNTANIQYGIFNGTLGICSNIIDLSKFIQLLMNGKLPFPKKESMVSGNNQIIPTKLSKETYSGIGWHIINTNNKNYTLANIGASNGSRTFCGFIPDKNIGIVIFSNSQIGINGLDFMVLDYLNAKL
ncbi:MAG TPA: serine hydrolase domain-containing protein [Saprospiraceae bacterium]|nr:serine hydrolase domain-containing protein [Saprospiraceae bacterium]